MIEANKIVENSKKKHAKVKRKFNKKLKSTNGICEDYGKLSLKIKSETFKKLADLLMELDKSVKLSEISSVGKIDLSIDTAKQFRKDSTNAIEVLGTLATSVGAGASAATGTFALVGMLGTASTGTAIGSLSGAAATNATLAWLGGGSLAAGGGGIAAGTAMLGGLALGPALLIGGIALNIKGEKAFTKAEKYAADVEIAIEKINSSITYLNRLDNQVKEGYSVLKKLNKRAKDIIDKLNKNKITKEDIDYNLLSLSLQLCKSLKDIIDTNIITENGNINRTFKTKINKYN